MEPFDSLHVLKAVRWDFFFLKLHFEYHNIFIGFLMLVQNINFSKLSFTFLLDDLRGESLVITLKS